MKNLHLTKTELKQIEEGIQVETFLGGFPVYCVKYEYGEFHTPNGIRFEVNFFMPTNLDLTINGENQSEDNLQ